MLTFLDSGGPFMYVILFVSIGAFSLFCERAIFLYLKLSMNTDKAYKKIMVLLDNANYRAAIEECNKIISHPLGRILKSGLLKAGKRDKEIEQAMQEGLLREVPLLKKRINYLSMFANVATLLGLLGTIIGLIAAFQGVSEVASSQKQEVLSAGISVAMFTTAFGLIVSIPCLMGFYLLNNRCEYLIDQFEEKALALFNVVSTMKRESQNNA